MGIKFLCPSGHKLHVKSFLAGKRAFCPKCGARVVVPNDDQAGGDASGEAVALSTESGDIATRSVVLPQVATATGVPAAGASTSTARAIASGGGHAIVGVAAPAVAAPLSDPLAEAPGATWYVRPASGGQFGPAPAEVMRSWLKEGRIGGGSLLWRDGWPEWRSAAEVFPELAGPTLQPAAPPPANPPAPAASPIAVVNGQAVAAAGLPRAEAVTKDSANKGALPADVTPMAPGMRRKRRTADKNVVLTVGLAIVSLVLVIILAVVIIKQKPAAPESPSTPAATPAPAAPTNAEATPTDEMSR